MARNQFQHQLIIQECMMTKKYLILCYMVITLSLFGCDAKAPGRYMFNSKDDDLLELFSNGTWRRTIDNGQFIEEGTWFIEENHIWFDHWKFHGECSNPYNQNGFVFTSFSIDKSIDGHLTKIYTGLEDDVFFERIN